ncbi:MAG: hypothetical protein WCS85_02875 [Candidatus Peribacteraceae bacterium]|jgi:hypothetical protein
MRFSAKRFVKGLLAAALVAVLLGAYFRITGYNPFTGFSEWKAEGIVIPNEQDTNQNPDVISLRDGCYRLYAHGAKDRDGKNSIYSYHSCDGLRWEFEGKRVDQASMPAAVLAEDGTVRLYFQRGMGDGQQALMVAVSDDGLNFQVNGTPLLITGQGELVTIKTMAHFELLRLEHGYRMYFDEGGLVPTEFERYKDEQWTWPVTRIRSLYSADGLRWSLEPGVRIEYEQQPLRYMQRAGSCTVVHEEDGYHMFFNAGFSPWEDLKSWRRWSWSGIYEAVSDDGLEWNILDKNLFQRGSDPKILHMGNETRIYISEGERVGGNSIESYVRR